MDNLTIETIYSVMVLVACGLGIYNVFKNHNTDYEKSGIDEGTKMSDLNHIKEALDKIEKSMKSLDAKVDDKYRTIEQDFRELLISNTRLEEQYKSLHKRVDEVCKQLHTNEEVK